MAVVLFDGVCNLCNGFVRFVVARDPAAYFRFAALTSEAAARLLSGRSLATPHPESIVLVEDAQVFVRSEAVLRIARHLTFPWPLAYGLLLVPRRLRDWAYDAIARRRYRWFGKQETCMIPGPPIGERFLSDAAESSQSRPRS